MMLFSKIRRPYPIRNQLRDQRPRTKKIYFRLGNGGPNVPVVGQASPPLFASDLDRDNRKKHRKLLLITAPTGLLLQANKRRADR